jgi:hypothetical protein
LEFRIPGVEVSKHFTTKSVEMPKCQNAKLQNAVSTKAEVTTIGHIDGRWGKELVKTSSFSEFRGSEMESTKILHHDDPEMPKSGMPK